MMSIPGTEDDKFELINCVSCHTLERVVKSTYNADELVPVIQRMNSYAQVEHRSSRSGASTSRAPPTRSASASRRNTSPPSI